MKQSKIYTLDIETDSQGEVLDIGFYDGEVCRYYDNWEKFYNDLLKIESSAMIYAHNGGGFDYVSFLFYLFKNGIEFYAMLKQSKIFAFNLTTKPNIKFVDSYCIMPMSLNDLTKSFSELQKLDLGGYDYSEMETFKNSDSVTYYNYLERDLISLYQAVIKMQSLVNEIHAIGNLPLSIGGISLKLFQKRFSEKIGTPSRSEKMFTFNSYVGGRCEFLGFAKSDLNGWFENVNGYDFNSHYPSQMINDDFPIWRGAYTTEFIRDNKGLIRSGVYNAKFDQINGRFPYLQNAEKEYCFDGYGCFTNYELNYIEKIGGKIDCLGGYHYEFAKPIFNEFVKFFFDRRLDAQKISDEARSLFYKLVLNNLYGKFGQRDEVESLEVLDFRSVSKKLTSGETLNEVYRIDDDLAFYSVKKEKQCLTSFPAIASMITAKARLRLYDVLESVKYPLYCDTDSIHCIGEIDSGLIGNDLGKLKVEFYKAAARYGGKKSYEITDVKSKQKGIPKVNINEQVYNDLFTNGQVKVNYKKPLMLKSAIRSNDLKNPNMFRTFTRTITKDKSLAEKLGITNFD